MKHDPLSFGRRARARVDRRRRESDRRRHEAQQVTAAGAGVALLLAIGACAVGDNPGAVACLVVGATLALTLALFALSEA